MPNETTQARPPESGGAIGSAACSECGWTNVNLLNLGEPGKSRMVCHGCCKRMLEAVDACRAAMLRAYPVLRAPERLFPIHPLSL
jgi:hypothetical protein